MDDKNFYDVVVKEFSFLIGDGGFIIETDNDSATPFIFQVIFKGQDMAFSIQRDTRERGLYPSVMRLIDGKVPQWTNRHILNLNLILKQLDPTWVPPEIDWTHDRSQEHAIGNYAQAVKRWSIELFDPESTYFDKALVERKMQFGV